MQLGEWKHGWQFHASDAAESRQWDILLQELAWPSTRRNAASSGKARMYSCTGPFAATWLTVCPTSDALSMSNAVMQFAIRRRLGIAVCFDGPECMDIRFWQITEAVASTPGILDC